MNSGIFQAKKKRHGRKKRKHVRAPLADKNEHGLHGEGLAQDTVGRAWSGKRKNRKG